MTDHIAEEKRGVLRRLLMAVTKRQDLAVVFLLITAIVMMVLPLPTWLVDFLLASNMGLTVLLLMVAVYMRHPTDFSTLPAVILMSTVFRLALSITTTRLILIQADAGSIVETFGNFVVGGNLIVGLVIFLIITVVQFVVITKGAERIAEVSARFTLDALPGKQMSIDSDLRSGDIDQAEARRRRQNLEKESQIYGAMDGTMKFVKGDAIAGLVIIAVNLLGGVAVGTMQHGMPLGEALQVYSLLTVGDGLVGQIPALFISITSGAFVTRVTSEESENLGSDIIGQLVSDPRSLGLAAVILLLMAAVPGFPSAIFLFLAGFFGILSFTLSLRKKRERAEVQIEEPEFHTMERERRRGPSSVVVARVAPDLYEDLDVEKFQPEIRKLREDLYLELGVQFPGLWLEPEPELEDGHFRIDIEGVPTSTGELRPGSLLLSDDPEALELADVPYEKGKPLLGRDETYWIEGVHARRLKEAGIGSLNSNAILACCVGETLTKQAAGFMGIQETQSLLEQAAETHGDLVKEAQRQVPLQKIADVLRRLLDEEVAIRNMRMVLEALVEWGGKEQDPVLLTEYVRSSLKRQICFRYADTNKMLAGVIFEKDAEEIVRNAVRQTSVGSYLALEDKDNERLISAVRRVIEDKASDSLSPIILTALDVRRHVRSLLQKNDIDLPVLSYQDLAPDFTVQPIGTIRFAPREPVERDSPEATEVAA